MKIRPKTFKLLKELLLEKGGVFYNGDRIIDFKFNGNAFHESRYYYSIEDEEHLLHWLTCDDWYIKV